MVGNFGICLKQFINRFMFMKLMLHPVDLSRHLHTYVRFDDLCSRLTPGFVVQPCLGLQNPPGRFYQYIVRCLSILIAYF